MEIHCPHDRFFKHVMSDLRIATDFFKNYLPPAILSLIDFDSLKLLPSTYIEMNLKLTSSDLLYTVNIAGEKAYIYLLCEHQSKIEDLMPFRLLQYRVNIWNDHLKKTRSNKLPLIIPIVFYHGIKAYDGKRRIQDLIEGPENLIEETLFGPFHLIDMHEIEDEALREQHWAGIMGFVLKHIFARDFLIYLKPLFEMISKLTNLEKETSTDYIKAMIFYIMNRGNAESPERLLEDLTAKLSKISGGENMIMSAAEYLRQEGREKGRQEGREEGRQQEITLLVRLLQRKFGFLPDTYLKRIETADSNTLLALGDRVLEAKTLQELFDEPVLA